MSGRARVALWIAGIAVGIASAMVTAESDRIDRPGLAVALTLAVGWAFIVGGLVALERRPDNRFGLLMIAVGFAWFASSLGASSNETLFSVGVLLSSLYLGFLAHAILAYPTGRLTDRASVIVVAVAYVLTTVGAVAISLIATPEDFGCDDCPDNAFMVSHHPQAFDALMLSINLIALALSAAAAVILWQRWKRASETARRTMAPVLLAGGVAVGAIAVDTLIQLFTEGGVVLYFVTNLALALIPIAFLAGILRTSLSRSTAVAALVHDLGNAGGTPAEVRVALARALNDPSLAIAYWIPEKARFVDADGVPAFDPAPGRVTAVVEREGRPVARLDHDVTLQEDPGLLQAASAAAALALENARLTTELRARIRELSASERRWREMLERIQLIAVSLDREGRIIYANPFLGAVTGWHRDELMGRDWLDVFNPDDREFMERMRRDDLLPYEENYVLTRSGERRIIAWSNTAMRDVDGSVIGSTSIGADITERRRAEQALRDLLIEHTALERIARLVAEGRSPEVVFARVTEEAGRLLGATGCDLVQFGPEGEAGVVLAGWGSDGIGPVPMGTVVPTDGETAADRVRAARGPVRVDDYAELHGAVADRVREGGVRSAIGAPITVAGEIWGALTITATADKAFPEGAEHRLEAFAALVGLAIANADAREQLAASRARIVAAGDAERRRLERNLHDGAQQRLVSLSLTLRLVQKLMPKDPELADRRLTEANVELGEALEELRELARGIHPAILSDRGLRPALEALANRPVVSMPVELEELPEQRLPEQIEAAAYYVVAESLTNAARYSQATRARVRIVRDNGLAIVEVHDDGIGGADPASGSGLRGLSDRIEALDGRFEVTSTEGEGTIIRAEIPCAS